MKILLIAAALAAPLSGPAVAGAFKVGDLGEMASRQECMEIAGNVLEAYVAEYGGLSTTGDAADPKSWSFYAWGLRPGVIDAVITCPVVGAQVNAFYTLHASGDSAAEDADIAAERLRGLWEKIR